MPARPAGSERHTMDRQAGDPVHTMREVKRVRRHVPLPGAEQDTGHRVVGERRSCLDAAATASTCRASESAEIIDTAHTGSDAAYRGGITPGPHSSDGEPSALTG